MQERKTGSLWLQLYQWIREAFAFDTADSEDIYSFWDEGEGWDGWDSWETEVL